MFSSMAVRAVQDLVIRAAESVSPTWKSPALIFFSVFKLALRLAVLRARTASALVWEMVATLVPSLVMAAKLVAMLLAVSDRFRV